jgi:hypothetical protein
MQKSGYRIGITIFVNADGKLSLFENGLRQNVLFLYRLFAASPHCESVVLLNHGDGELTEDPSRYGIPASAVMRSAAQKTPLDYLIVTGAAVDAGTIAAMKAQGTKIISYKGGNGGVISMEAMAARPPRADAERYFDRDYYDAVWLTPQHWRTYRGWCQTIYRCPVRQIQQVWEPLVIQALLKETPFPFGYEPGKPQWRIGIMDPNITVMKTSHFPMMVCEQAYRRRPDIFKAIYVTNGLPHAENAHFVSFTSAMTAYKAGIMTLEPRFVGAMFMGQHADAIVTHHWENGLNYLYYEVLYGGYPLIHNAHIRPAGYAYEDFDVEDGARALLRAKERHDDELPAYRATAAALIDSVRPQNPAVLKAHEDLLAGA